MQLMRMVKDRLMPKGSINDFDARYVSRVPAVIVGGVARSGTTLLRTILDSHRNLCCGPESGLFVLPTFDPKDLAFKFDIPDDDLRRLMEQARSRAQFIEIFMSSYARRAGKPRWAEKTPQNLHHLDFIFRAFPNARFIHIIRDGRDVACSLRTHPRYKVVDGELVPTGVWKPIEPCIQAWVDGLEAARPYRSDPRYLEIRYEDLVSDTEQVLRKVFAFLDEPWDEQVLRYYEINAPSRDYTKFPQNKKATAPIDSEAVSRWRQDLSDDDKAIIKRVAGNWLIEMGYAESSEW